MSANKTIVGLDLGTDKFKILIGEKTSQGKKIRIVGQFEKPSAGVRRGWISDKEDALKRLKDLIETSQRFTSRKIDSVFLNIGGSHITCLTSQGTVAVSRADGKISEEDKERVEAVSQNIKLPPNREVLISFPQEFIIDGEKGIKDPVGMNGIKLEVKTLLILVFTPYLKNLTETVTSADIEINDIQPSALASARAVLTKQQKELGVALLDIGAGTTSMAVFEEGTLIHVAVLPIGSAHITNDIAVGLRCSTHLAERIKREYGSSILRGGKRKKGKIKISDEGESVTFSKKLLTKIIESRVSEIFEQVNKELKKISRQSLLPAGVVITGGGSKLPRIVDLAKKELKLPARLGIPKGFSNFNEDPSWSVASGLVLYGFDLEEEGGEGGIRWGSPFVNLKRILKKIFKLLIP